MKLWKENLLSKEYSLTHQEIADKFMESEQFKNFMLGVPLRRCLLGFIGGPGLNSSMEDNPEKDLVAIEKIILKDPRTK